MLCITLLLGAPQTEAAGMLVNGVRPHITGPASVGATLTTTKGSWTGLPNRYGYQWWHCMPMRRGGCTPTVISRGAHYVVRASDVGGTVYARVRAHNARGWSRYVQSANSIGPITSPGAPVNKEPPYASGNLAPGRLVTTTDGRWSGPVSGYHYQWFECDFASPARCAGDASPIDGATDYGYVIKPDLVGDYIYVAVSAYNRSGSATPVMSSVLGPITGSPVVPPINEAPPLIRGNATIGSTLRVDLGDWDGLPDAYAYEWLSCSRQDTECAVIPRQTGPTYLVTLREIGKWITVTVIARNANGWSELTESKPIGPVTSRSR
jgi:hypothetical protein